MDGTVIAHYTILRKLGEGGMGIVYMAHDNNLDRDVALKFLPERLTATADERARFLQEARAASSLSHPNVCHINAIVEAGGRQFIDMELIEGTTLRERIPVPKVSEALGFAIQIGDALTEAHAKGIVHRDIKADNIMVTPKQQVKVMDFGLAKLKGSLKLTRTSSTIGTLAYMAPEQVQGGEVDARSDIFSFGVVLFEMLTGHLPFRGEHEAAMMYSILNEEPASLAHYRADVSGEVERIIRRALEKDPAERYQHADDMVSELRKAQKQSAHITRPVTGPLPGPAAPPSPAAPAPEAARRRGSILYAAGAAFILIAAAGAFLLLRPPARNPAAGAALPGAKKMLVVLPFENLGTPDQEYFAEGVTEEITSRLSGLSGLGVIAPSSAAQYRKTAKSIRQIGDELGVTYILQGTVRWEKEGSTSRVRVNPQLINVADGTQIWSQPSEAVLASAFQIQSDIATSVAGALNVTLLSGERQSLEGNLTSNPDAYDAYIRAKPFIYGGGERNYRVAETMLTKAVTLDPGFVAAHAYLAAIHAAIYWEYYDHTPERVAKAKAEADRTAELAPNSPEAHSAMGYYLYHCLRAYDRALAEFNAGLAVQPNNIDFLLGAAAIYRRLGKFDDAERDFVRIVEINPRSTGLLIEHANTLVLLRRYDEAIRVAAHASEISPDAAEPYFMRALCTLYKTGDCAAAAGIVNAALAQKVGVGDPDFFYFKMLIDIDGGSYEKVLDELKESDLKAFQYQYWWYPKPLYLAELEGYLRHPDAARTYYDEARATLEEEVRRHPEDSRLHSALGIAYAGLGRKDDAVREGRKGVALLPISLDAAIGTVREQELALIYAMTGDQNAAIDLLGELLAIPSYLSPALLRVDPIWTPLRANPRFQKLTAQQPA